MAFVIVFEQPFSPDTCEKFLALQNVLSKDFPSFNRTQNIEVKVTDEKNVEQSEQLNGIVMQKAKESGEPEWQLRAQGNSIIASCFDYDRWKSESEKAVSYLLKVASSVEQGNPVSVVGLQTVDKFMDDSAEKYQISGVFNSNSKFLTKQVLDAGHLWHIHQGWFEKANQDDQCLNVLNLSTNSIPEGISTSIDHSSQMIFKSGKSIKSLKNELSDTFGILHEKNKEVVRELLSSDQKDIIGL